VAHAARIEDAGMADDALERLVPVAGDPIHHVAAIRSAERANAIAVEPGILRERRLQALLQIFERLAAPVVADRIRERLAVARRAVEVDEDRRVAGAGVRLRIPAIAP